MIIKLPFSCEAYCAGSFCDVREQLRTVLESFGTAFSDTDECHVLDIAERDTDFNGIAAKCVSSALSECFELNIEFENVLSRGPRGVYADIDAATVEALRAVLLENELSANCLRAEEERLANCYSAPEGAEIAAAPISAAWSYVVEYCGDITSSAMSSWDDEIRIAAERALDAYRALAAA